MSNPDEPSRCQGDPEDSKKDFETFEEFVNAQPEEIQDLTRELRDFTLKLHRMDVKYILAFSPTSEATGAISNLQPGENLLAMNLVDHMFETLKTQQCMPPNITGEPGF